MAEIKPFRGVVYDPEKVGDMAKVMAPPYDVISPDFQDRLYSRHPNNIVRLILGKSTPGDVPGNDRYSRAAADLDKWMSQGVLKRDERPAIYYYTQTYAPEGGVRLKRKGFIALSMLEDLGKGKIHAHEKTLSGPKADRLKLIEASRANFSCIFSLYSEHQFTINKLLEEHVKDKKPVIDVPDDDGVENTVFRIDDPGVIEKVASIMKDKALFIADGHHRYETALNYRNLMREKHPESKGTEAFNYVMMYFSNMDDEGMTIWPTHRVVHGIEGFSPEEFLRECGKYFDIEEIEYDASTEYKAREQFIVKVQEAGDLYSAMGLHIGGRNSYYVLTLRTSDVMDEVFGSAIPEVFKDLDVTVLHSLVLDKLLGITQEAQEKQKNLIYVKSYHEAFKLMEDETNQLVFLLNPTRIEQVKAVAEAGSVMPQKSTYFYPKLLTGLVMNLHTEEPVTA